VAFYPPSNSSSKLVFDDGLDTPSQLFFKLSWDNKRPASSDFTLGKKKSVGAIVDEYGG
jgi:hypothetical protein